MAENLKNAPSNISEEGIKQLNELMSKSDVEASLKSDSSLEPQGIGCDLAYAAAIAGCNSIKDPTGKQACLLVAKAAYDACNSNGW